MAQNYQTKQQQTQAVSYRTEGVLDAKEKERLIMKHSGIFKHAIKEYAALMQKTRIRPNKNYSR